MDKACSDCGKDCSQTIRFGCTQCKRAICGECVVGVWVKFTKTYRCQEHGTP